MVAVLLALSASRLPRVGGVMAMVVGMLLGCAGPYVSLNADADPPGTSYQGSFTRWTRDGRVIVGDELDTMLLVSATLRSRAFQRAYSERVQKLYVVNTPSEQQRLLQEDLAVATSGLSFWVQSASHNYNWNDLAPEHALWRMVLVDDQGVETPPDSVIAVRARQLLETALFGQYPNSHVRTWQLHFPAQRSDGQPLWQPGTKKLLLRFAGPPGHTDLVWLIK